MAGKKQKKNRKISIVLTVILFVLIGIAMIIYSLKGEKEGRIGADGNVANEFTPMKLDYELEIIEAGPYEGVFMEDGSDEIVEDILMIIVKNNGNQALQYAELKLSCGEDVAEFSFSTLLPGEEVLVLEKNRMTYKGTTITEAVLENVVFFQEEISLCEDIFSITTMEGAFNIENISEEAVKGPIAVYYKNKNEDMSLGGITYRAVIEEDLEAGEIMQVMTKHFSPQKSEMMFVTYMP